MEKVKVFYRLSDYGYQKVKPDYIDNEKDDSDEGWLLEQTENFCKDKAVYNAITESIHIIDGKSNTNKTENAIPEILSDALSVSFDAHIGHDYIEDSDDRFKFYHKVESKVPFDISLLKFKTMFPFVEAP